LNFNGQHRFLPAGLKKGKEDSKTVGKNFIGSRRRHKEGIQDAEIISGKEGTGKAGPYYDGA